MRSAIIVGTGSDIAGALALHLKFSGWRVFTCWSRAPVAVTEEWDLLLLPVGTLEPIGKFMDCDFVDWQRGVSTNCFHPLQSLRTFWSHRKPGATVVFFSGPNMAHPSPTYSAYRAGKAVLEALVGTLEAEYPEVRFRILRPGVVNTKIHQQTLQAGERAANYERVKKIVAGEEATVSYDEVYERLKTLL